MAALSPCQPLVPFPFRKGHLAIACGRKPRHVLDSLGCGDENSARRNFKHHEFWAEFAELRHKMWNREKARDLLAEINPFEPEGAF
jgi:hypothetical protein